MPRKLTTEEFIEKAKAVHGDTYDYSQVVYVNASTKCDIVCKTHGTFQQSPNAHLSGKGCAACGVRVKSTTDEFIEKARKVHGDKYDYSQVEYVGIDKPCGIRCRIHGEMTQTAHSHLHGFGCRACGVDSRAEKNSYTLLDFVIKAEAVHGDKYDYSQVEYVNSKTKCDIVCKTHGAFQQAPKDHLVGRGCPACGGRVKRTTDEFIEKARKVHGDKYDYLRVKYVNDRTKCDIVCKTHGVFPQKPSGHLAGYGCPKCGTDSVISKLSHTQQEFLVRAGAVHGDKYDYSQVQYVNCQTRCDIICKTHGLFRQSPAAHVKGQCCTKCVFDSRAEKRTHTLLYFVIKAEAVHGDKYDYSQVQYVNNRTKCDIVCKTHGTFQQSPNAHLCGRGCPSCNESKGEIEVAKLLAEYNLKFKEQKRFKGLRYKNPLRCDFYIPEINTVIEYQGPHHYGIGINADRDEHNTIPIRDEIKRKFCKAKGIHLIEIPYWEDTETYLLGALLPILSLYPLKDLAS